MPIKPADHTAGDRATKQIVVGSLCFIGVTFAATVCALSLRGVVIPDALDRLSIFVLGGISGLLSKTSTDAPSGQRRADNAPAGTPADPVSVEAVGTDGGAVVVEEK